MINYLSKNKTCWPHFNRNNLTTNLYEISTFRYETHPIYCLYDSEVIFCWNKRCFSVKHQKDHRWCLQYRYETVWPYVQPVEQWGNILNIFHCLIIHIYSNTTISICQCCCIPSMHSVLNSEVIFSKKICLTIEIAHSFHIHNIVIVHVLPVVQCIVKYTTVSLSRTTYSTVR